MLPRRQRSIFHLGEEGGDGDDRRGGAHRDDHAGYSRSVGGDNAGHHHLGGRSGHGWDAAVVGLRILVTQNRHHRAPASSSHIVLKQMVLPPAAAAARRCRGPCSFLTACSLCRRELSPNRDVYMYRGDHGFCSEECRWRQILVDEARERESMTKQQRRGLSVQHHHGPRPAAAAIRGVPRRLLAVA